MIGVDVGGLDSVCTTTDDGPSAISGPAIDEGDLIWSQLRLRLVFGKV